MFTIDNNRNERGRILKIDSVYNKDDRKEI